jgi:chemosensory pili system protein ChpA (sensor histidine kinase/response regulator)
MALPLIEIPAQTTSDEIDEEILEIFIEEAEEVLAEIHDAYALWKNNPSDKEALTTVRRAFHTLKGSGRLVGAMAIGEFGWAFENMLNRVLDGTLAPNSTLFKLIDPVEDAILELIEQFKNNQPPSYEAVLLMSQARHFTDTKGADYGTFVSAADAAQPSLNVTDTPATTSKVTVSAQKNASVTLAQQALSDTEQESDLDDLASEFSDNSDLDTELYASADHTIQSDLDDLEQDFADNSALNSELYASADHTIASDLDDLEQDFADSSA